MNHLRSFLSLFLVSSCAVFAAAPKKLPPPKPEGWSVDVGGTYTWMSISTPPTYSGSTGGILGKLTYQVPDAFFGQGRTYYNLGPLSGHGRRTKFYEWYTELVGGYCFSVQNNWTATLYGGLGIEFISDHHAKHHDIAAITLKYAIYYAIAGFETHYTWKNWMLGLQADCLPTFNQYLKIKHLHGAAWTLDNRIGADVQVPVSYRYVRNYWLTIAPYYRYLPIGDSDTLGLPDRNLNQWGVFVSFRFYL